MDVYRHTENLLSIMDGDGELNINDKKWDGIFSDVIANTDSYYFLGYRIEPWAKEIEAIIGSLSERIVEKKDNYFSLALKIVPGNIIISRGLLSKLWECYECPAIFFMKKDILNEERVEELFRSQWTYDHLCSSIKGSCCISRDIGFNVMWIRKISDMPFPAAL